MATQLEQLQKMMESMRTPGMTQTTGIASGSISNDTKGRSASFSGMDSARVRRPGMTAGVSSVPTTNPAERVARANRILETPVQRSRTDTEAKLNPQVGEALRRSLIEQQRVSGPTYGSMGAFDRRDRRQAQQTAQTAVDSNLAALQGIREGGLMERGQNLQATTTLENRQMQEAGAFDRALLGIDQTMLEGQFGMADREAATAAAVDPLKAFALTQLRALAGGANATAEDQRQVANAALGLSELSAPGPGATFSFDPTGLSGDFTAGALEDPRILSLVSSSVGGDTGASMLQAGGYSPDPDSALGMRPTAEINAEREARRLQREQQLQEEERQRKAAVAAYIRDNPLDPSVRINMINNQTR